MGGTKSSGATRATARCSRPPGHCRWAVSLALPGDPGSSGAFWATIRRAGGGATVSLRTLLDPLEAYCMLMGGILKEEKAFLLRPEIVRRFRDYDDYWFFREHWIADLDPFTRLQYLDLKTYLPDDILTKVDRASMAVSLEVRVPILDHEVVAFAFSLPVAVRNPGNRPKYLLKRMLAPFLPETILERRKQGFAIPLSRWAEGGMLEGSGGEIPFLQPRPPRGANRSEFALLLDALLRGWFAEHAPSSGG
ncbi:MAG: hypothetical protein D6795_10385 [Deltaproteobacteria bacterium]|nr:MAG: hypothetical protein D6795_10385 [Deltaproteobacteria bacterium]